MRRRPFALMTELFIQMSIREMENLKREVDGLADPTEVPCRQGRTFRVGLIGAGGIGNLHIRCLQQLEREGRVRLCAIADPTDTPLVREHRQQSTALGRTWYEQYADMLKREKLDLVVIATPIHLHFSMLEDCLKQGVPVYLEKPPVPLLSQIEYLLETYPSAQVCVGFQHIGSSLVQELKQRIMDGKFGEIRDIQVSAAWPRSDAYYQRAAWAGRMMFHGEVVFDGPATNALAHVLHTALYLGGEERDRFTVPLEVQAELYRVRPIEGYDLISLRAGLASGSRLTAALTHAADRALPFRISVRGSDGWGSISDDGLSLETHSGESFSVTENELKPFLRCHAAFLDYLDGKRSGPHTGLLDALGFVQLTNAALLASGGVRTVPGQNVVQSGEDGERIYAVAGIADVIRQAAENNRLFSELGCPWATPGTHITLDGSTAHHLCTESIL